jgi:hypothetical protein
MGRGQRRFAVTVGVSLVLGLATAGLAFWQVRAGAHNPCLEPGNLTFNCGFDTFVDYNLDGKRLQVPEGWWYFIISGDLEFRPSNDTYWGAPSLWLLSDGVPFCAGIYQEVDVTPGVVYQADAGWAAVTQVDFERKIGLDPTGGTDPRAASVVWGPSEWGLNSWPDLTVSARATGPKMTVFVWTHHPVTYGNDWIFIDAVGLWPDPSQPAVTLTPTPAPPTPTRPRATRTATAVLPTVTDTPTPEPPTPTLTSTPSPTVAPSETPTPTETATSTATPTPAPPTETPVPTRTPLPTVVPVARFVGQGSAAVGRVEPGAGILAGTESSRSGLLPYLALGALGGSGLLAAVVAWLRRRNGAQLEDSDR